MTRFAFNIRTRSGQRVQNISLMAPTYADAERRLRQMYQGCEIVRCQQSAVPRRVDARAAQEFVTTTRHRVPQGAVAVDDAGSAASAAANDAPKVIRFQRKQGAL
jgi:hypothetical protein